MNNPVIEEGFEINITRALYDTRVLNSAMSTAICVRYIISNHMNHQYVLQYMTECAVSYIICIPSINYSHGLSNMTHATFYIYA